MIIIIGGNDMNKNIISFLNMKGGVCKTTLCKEIALHLSNNMNKKVLVIDIDPQANCTQSFFEHFKVIQIKDDEIITDINSLPTIQNLYRTSGSMLEGANTEKIVYKLTDNLHLIPGELNVYFMDREIGSGAAEHILCNFVEDSDFRKKYDYIFIDCPPTYSFYTITALLTSDFYLVPVVPDAYSMLGVSMLDSVVDRLKGTYRRDFDSHSLDCLGIIFTKIDSNPSKGIKRNMKNISKAFKDTKIFNTVFPNSPKLITSDMSKFISDRQDTNLITSLEDICIEFDKEVTIRNEE